VNNGRYLYGIRGVAIVLIFKFCFYQRSRSERYLIQTAVKKPAAGLYKRILLISRVMSWIQRLSFTQPVDMRETKIHSSANTLFEKKYDIGLPKAIQIVYSWLLVVTK